MPGRIGSESPVSDLEIPLFSLRHGNAAGLASAVYNLVAGFTSLQKSISLPFTTADRLDPGFVSWAQRDQHQRIRFRKFPAIPGGMATRFAEELIYANLAHDSNRVLYPNYFLPPQLVVRDEVRSVIIHDCQYRSFPQYFSAKKRWWLDRQFSRALSHADHIFLISEFERSQIARFFGDSFAERCHVTYNSIDWDRYERGVATGRAVAMAEQPYILSVGHQYPHKNTLKLIQAFLTLGDRYKDVRIIVVGKLAGDVTRFVDNELSQRDRARITLSGFISDADLGRLYRQARLFVLASSYEGFGMPAVEAMGFGVPVLVTEGTSLPEVTLGKAVYCADSSPVDQWAEAIGHCLDHPKAPEYYSSAAAVVRQNYAPAAVATRFLTALGLESQWMQEADRVVWPGR